MHNNLVILAGGASSRMKKEASVISLSKEEILQANERSKGLIGVGPNGRPLMDYLLNNAKYAGFKNIYIIVGPDGGKLFKTFYGIKDSDNDFHGLNISYAIQYVPSGRIKPFGTADALYQALTQYPELSKGSYTVCNSDNLYSVEALSNLRKSTRPNAFISYDRDALIFPEERIQRFALAKLDDTNNLVDIIEKPPLDKVDEFKDSYGKLRVSMNIFNFNGKYMFPYLKDCPVNAERDEKELPTALLNMLNDFPDSVQGIPLSEHVPDLTAKDDIVGVKKYLKENYGSLNWSNKVTTISS